VPKLENIKHEQFCQEYLIDLNATQAYIRAGYKAKDANVASSTLLANVSVRARIDELLADRSKRTGVTADRVVRELARLAFINPDSIIDINTATLKQGISEDDAAAIAGVKVKQGRNYSEREIKFYDKNRSLELLGKHLGMFTDNLNISVQAPQIIDDVPAGVPDG
jgi:phage terminase small subunit